MTMIMTMIIGVVMIGWFFGYEWKCDGETS